MSKYQVTCKQCGGEFSTNRKNSVFCSHKCLKKWGNIHYKDKIRHGGKRSSLLTNVGVKCSQCGCEGTTFDIVAHHLTGNNQDHEHQVLLCRSCHMKLHTAIRGDIKPISREDMRRVIEESQSIAEAAAKLGLSKATMYEKRKKYGLRISKDKKYISLENFKTALESSKNTKEAMKKLGIASTETFFRKKKAFGLMTIKTI
jgi:AraC-like DNA-binding protein